jgi:hypothetical protein
MTLSPPITVLAIVIAAMAGTALFASPPTKLAQLCTDVPNGSSEKLVIRTLDKVRADGSSQAVRPAKQADRH